MEQIQTDSGSDAREQWTLAFCLVMAVICGPFIIAGFVAWFIVESNPMNKVVWLGVWIFGLPVSMLIACGTAWLVKKGGKVRFVSLLSIAGLSTVLASVLWNALPPTHHFKDVDNIPECARFESQLDNIEVDHVYFYSTRTLFCNYYLRCHIVRKADFERLRAFFSREAAYRKTTQDSGERDDKTLVRELGTGSGDFEAIRSWWDWPGRPDCEVFCLQYNDLVAFDPARGVIYLVKNSD